MGRPRSCDTLASCNEEIVKLEEKLNAIRVKKQALEEKENSRLGELFRQTFGSLVPDKKAEQKAFLQKLRDLYDASVALNPESDLFETTDNRLEFLDPDSKLNTDEVAAASELSRP